jgi:pyridoxine 5'-phosphate synthase PdxJ
MPDNILIDNFHHGYAHIRPDRREIKTQDLQSTLIIVLKHINTNKEVKYGKLREELII